MCVCVCVCVSIQLSEILVQIASLKDEISTMRDSLPGGQQHKDILGEQEGRCGSSAMCSSSTSGWSLSASFLRGGGGGGV